MRSVAIAVGILCIAAAAPAKAARCTPGQSIACVGPGGCKGGQVCNPDGHSFGACDCGGASAPGSGADRQRQHAATAPGEHVDAGTQKSSRADAPADAQDAVTPDAERAAHEPAVVVPPSGSSGALDETPREGAHETTRKTKYGFAAFAFGPNSLGGAAFAYQAPKLIESQIGLAYGQSSAEATSAGAHASGTLTAFTFRGNVRFWLFDHHSLIFDLGTGITSYNLSVTGSDNAGNSIDYSRKGSPLFVFGGLGYGYRSQGSFRIAALVGGVVYLQSLNDSSVTTTGAFSPADQASIKSSLDSTAITSPHAYVELSIGFLF